MPHFFYAPQVASARSVPRASCASRFNTGHMEPALIMNK
jgi:hypothetical protein